MNHRFLWFLTILPLLVPATTTAQPTMASLWPDADGLHWWYDLTITNEGGTSTVPAHLWFEGETMTAGGPARILRGVHDTGSLVAKRIPDLPAVLREVWRARPDLREAIEARYTLKTPPVTWHPLLLHDGFWMRTPSTIEMWQEDFDHRTWVYLTDEISPGSTFDMQLVPELADDVHLHVTVENVHTPVTTIAGLFPNAVRVTYVVDHGLQNVTREEDGMIIGTVRAETRGHVHYVPDVGPVEMLQDFYPVLDAECDGGCPQDLLDLEGISLETMSLDLQTLPVPTATASWGSVKALY